jgi:hypothetical protein
LEKVILCLQTMLVGLSYRYELNFFQSTNRRSESFSLLTPNQLLVMSLFIALALAALAYLEAEQAGMDAAAQQVARLPETGRIAS